MLDRAGFGLGVFQGLIKASSSDSDELLLCKFPALVKQSGVRAAIGSGLTAARDFFSRLRKPPQVRGFASSKPAVPSPGLWNSGKNITKAVAPYAAAAGVAGSGVYAANQVRKSREELLPHLSSLTSQYGTPEARKRVADEVLDHLAVGAPAFVDYGFDRVLERGKGLLRDTWEGMPMWQKGIGGAAAVGIPAYLLYKMFGNSQAPSPQSDINPQLLALLQQQLARQPAGFSNFNQTPGSLTPQYWQT